MVEKEDVDYLLECVTMPPTQQLDINLADVEFYLRLDYGPFDFNKCGLQIIMRGDMARLTGDSLLKSWYFTKIKKKNWLIEFAVEEVFLVG